MQRCPTCNRTHLDNAPTFCPHDGTRLIHEAAAYNFHPTLASSASGFAPQQNAPQQFAPQQQWAQQPSNPSAPTSGSVTNPNVQSSRSGKRSFLHRLWYGRYGDRPKQKKPLDYHAFYTKDPDLTLRDLKGILQARYPTCKINLEDISISTMSGTVKGVTQIRVKKSFRTCVKVYIGPDHLISLDGKLGNGILEGIVEVFYWFLFPLEFLVEDKHVDKMSDYLRANFGETEHLICAPCDIVHPHYLERCSKCGNTLQTFAQ